MTESTGPRSDVLAERIEGVKNQVKSLETSVSKLATKDELIQFMAARDALMNQQLADLRDDQKELSQRMATERAERMAADKENEERANRARTFALSSIGLVITVVLGLIALINQVGGTPA